jgi:lipopolysaccharide/colanic/teichoic acid biosynthesis glycosyltransferase
LPQFINVFLGQMSLVGPRPLPSQDYAALSGSGLIVEAFYQERARAKPGITGLWQISGRSNLSFTDMVLLDLYYIETSSIMFDLEIMIETVPVVLFKKGAY